MRMPLGSVFRAMVVVAVTFSAGCSDPGAMSQIAAQVQMVLARKPPGSIPGPVWTDVRNFYAGRNNEPAWVAGTHLSKGAVEALTVLRTAGAHALNPDDYGEPLLTRLATELDAKDRDSSSRARRLADFDVRVTGALLWLARDVALGRSSPERLDPRWKKQRQAPDFVAMLQRSASGGLDGWLESVRPRHPEYRALQDALSALHGQAAKGGWPAVPGVPMKPGRTHDAVVALRQRLLAGGELKTAGARNPRFFDADLTAALKSFQTHGRLPATGTFDGPTAAAMNVPLDRRIAQIGANLERWRWMPDDLGARHLIINIPDFTLVARENGTPVLDIRVVVGKVGNETPTFSDTMTTVVFSPYWNIPDTIVEAETVPAMAQDSDYLSRNGIEVLRIGTQPEPVDSSGIDWDDPEVLRTLSFRQRPGPGNALGRVKFLFPNPYDVYLHDTPADSLFSRLGRTFSHGCIRVEEPEALAKYLLRDDPRWTDEEILRAMNEEVEQQVALTHRVPVHIVYFTAWVDPNGGLYFTSDPYGYDDKQLRVGTGSPSAAGR